MVAYAQLPARRDAGRLLPREQEEKTRPIGNSKADRSNVSRDCNVLVDAMSGRSSLLLLRLLEQRQKGVRVHGFPVTRLAQRIISRAFRGGNPAARRAEEFLRTEIEPEERSYQGARAFFADQHCVYCV